MHAAFSAHDVEGVVLGEIKHFTPDAIRDWHLWMRTVTIKGSGNPLELALFSRESETALMTPEELSETKAREEECRALLADQSNALGTGRLLGFPQGYVPTDNIQEMEAYRRWLEAGGKLDEEAPNVSIVF